VVLTGVSGSGKSSLAFDTLYAEGQRRYVESLSAYARQFLGQMEKPDVDAIEGLSPAIAIEQRSAGSNPRSTVGTITEIYDYLRLLFARLGARHCPECMTPLATPQRAGDDRSAPRSGARARASLCSRRSSRVARASIRKELDRLASAGLSCARVSTASAVELEEPPTLGRAAAVTTSRSWSIDSTVTGDEPQPAHRGARGRRAGLGRRLVAIARDDRRAMLVIERRRDLSTVRHRGRRVGAAPLLVQHRRTAPARTCDGLGTLLQYRSGTRRAGSLEARSPRARSIPWVTPSGTWTSGTLKGSRRPSGSRSMCRGASYPPRRASCSCMAPVTRR
jgi:excinuclease UvrABC ATPase subunit